MKRQFMNNTIIYVRNMLHIIFYIFCSDGLVLDCSIKNSSKSRHHRVINHRSLSWIKSHVDYIKVCVIILRRFDSLLATIGKYSNSADDTKLITDLVRSSRSP